MSRATDKRLDAADFLERNGCEIKQVMSDRRDGSYSVGRVGQDGYFLPTTWPSEAFVLDWVHGNHAAVRRAILGEPVEYHLYLEHAVAVAAERAGGDWYVFVAASGDALDQVELEAGRATDDELLDLLTDIRGMDPGDPERVLERVRDHLGLSAPSPRA